MRIGNARIEQFQLDVYGEVMDTLHLARAAGLPPEAHAWQIQRALLEFLDDTGSSPTRASGRSAGRGGISPTPR